MIGSIIIFSHLAIRSDAVTIDRAEGLWALHNQAQADWQESQAGSDSGGNGSRRHSEPAPVWAAAVAQLAQGLTGLHHDHRSGP